MNDPFDALNHSEWNVDLPSRLATHVTGLTILLSPDALFSDKWMGRCVNARDWAGKDPEKRSAQLPRLLHAGVAAFTRAHRQSIEKHSGSFFDLGQDVSPRDPAI